MTFKLQIELSNPRTLSDVAVIAQLLEAYEESEDLIVDSEFLVNAIYQFFFALRRQLIDYVEPSERLKELNSYIEDSGASSHKQKFVLDILLRLYDLELKKEERKE
jgi:hypothetical protein